MKEQEKQNQNNSTHADQEIVRNLDGIYVGLLNDDELESFHKCIEDKLAYQSYEGLGALYGLSKVKFIKY